MSTNLHKSGIIYGVWVFVCFLMCLGWLIKVFLALIPKVQILVRIPYRKHYRSFSLYVSNSYAFAGSY